MQPKQPKHWQFRSWSILVAASTLPLAVDCGGKMPGGKGFPGGGSGLGRVPDNCPDMASAEAVARFDWAKEFQLEASAGAKLKGGLGAALRLREMAADIDGDLKAACGGLAKDLGASGDFDNGHEACKAAMKAMGSTRAKIGGAAKFKLILQPPRCSVSMDAMAQCAGKCEGRVDPGKAEMTCHGEISGDCDAKCEGKCEISGSAHCEGSCDGACDAGFDGHCDGTCTGKCDGKDSKGTCSGKCDGKCSAGADGECKGKCSGTCKLKGAAECKGTCTGKCSVAMKEPQCSGTVKPPKVTAECKANCEAKLAGKIDCVPAHVAVVVDGTHDAAAAAQYKAALERHLPAVLKVAIGMRERLEGVAGDVKGVLGGVQAAARATKGGPVVAASLAACIAAPIKGAADAAASLRASVDVSVDVKASASAHGSASGKAG